MKYVSHLEKVVDYLEYDNLEIPKIEILHVVD